MVTLDNFNNLISSLTHGKRIPFSDEVFNKVNAERGLYNEVGSLPKQHVLNVYKLRYEISKENNMRDVEGFEPLLSNVENASVKDIFVSSLTFESARYFVFYGDSNNELFGILKLNKTNLEKVNETNKLYESKDVKTTSTSFNKGKLEL